MFGPILKDKIAFVTGGAIGIGEASVRHFVREGGKAVIIDVNRERARQVVDSLPQGAALFIETDVAREASVAEAIEKGTRHFGGIDILVNAAGITSLVGPVLVEDAKLDDWNRMMGINLTGAFLMTKHAIPLMKRRRYGRIVNISSTAALGGGYKGAAPYAASKAGLIGLTKEVAREVGGFGITVNAIGPGPTKTPTRKVLADKEAELSKTVPVGFLAEAEDIANTIAFLSSDAARFITGQILFVDGGVSIPWDIDAIISPPKA